MCGWALPRLPTLAQPFISGAAPLSRGSLRPLPRLLGLAAGAWPFGPGATSVAEICCPCSVRPFQGGASPEHAPSNSEVLPRPQSPSRNCKFQCLQESLPVSSPRPQSSLPDPLYRPSAVFSARPACSGPTPGYLHTSPPPTLPHQHT